MQKQGNKNLLFKIMSHWSFSFIISFQPRSLEILDNNLDDYFYLWITASYMILSREGKKTQLFFSCSSTDVVCFYNLNALLVLIISTRPLVLSFRCFPVIM